MPKPTIAAMPGAAAGAGLSLALACDLRYASEDAVFTTAFARVGFAGDYGGTWFLTRLVGPAKARELYFFAERFGAAEALRARASSTASSPPATSRPRCSDARAAWPTARGSPSPT